MLKRLILKIFLINKLKKKPEEYIKFLESQKDYTTTQEYVKNMLMDSTIEKYLDTFKKLENAEDFVPKNKLKKIRDLIFKDFLRKRKLDNKGYKAFVKINNKQEKERKWQDLSGFQIKKNEDITTT